MYCGQCGKKVLDTMLFCPFCGSPIVIPDQDEPLQAQPLPLQPEPVVQETEPMPEPEQEALPEHPLSLFDFEAASEPEAEPEPEPEPERPSFVPLNFDLENLFEEIQEEAKAPVEEPAVEAIEEEAPAPVESPRPVRRPSAETRRPERLQKRPANTYIPVKELAPDDIFMDEIHDDFDGDDYDDAYDRDPGHEDDGFIDDFEFEEREHGGFFQRHIRGIVGLILLLVLLLICAIWAFSPKGQLSLAKMNLAWTAQPYADLGYDAYLADSDLLAARYYEKALSRDASNYEYAHSAMVAYYEADEIESAAAMLKKCIEMNPDNPEPYQEMLILYPDKASRPWEISELIRLGYQRTGNEALNQN